MIGLAFASSSSRGIAPRSRLFALSIISANFAVRDIASCQCCVFVETFGIGSAGYAVSTGANRDGVVAVFVGSAVSAGSSTQALGFGDTLGLAIIVIYARDAGIGRANWSGSSAVFVVDAVVANTSSCLAVGCGGTLGVAQGI